ncbi:pleckstrin homology domain-containing family O member 2 isoform X1 [Cyclopterus lumpus]|uniref:pleckstrin homology domain-containing family O member 2 isoform X1 n=1 Tax=Cyclopterus lumpus TaxID=8103 RepID=UPI001487087F|nr:pleckstrin homology domain-containing family O member 2 isoform X1 [Cyclopterus lumpus]
MEDGAKEDPAQSKEPKFLGKAGWVKKAPGRLLASYKDRFVHVEKTEIVVYENENRQNCLERLDLENYDKCHELKSPFKKKHRLVLIRSPKPGNKVHDVKFQAQTAEEKEAWIKALIDGINRAKNKIFDEVTVDESINLEHVTRTRPKGNRNRRPPTRIHMKEVADVSSDGILRLDLDLENAIMPNGTHHAPIDGTETLKEAIKAPTPPSNASESAEKQTAEEEAPTEPQVSPQRKVFKPPMPPTKESKSCSTLEDQPDKDDDPVKKVKEAKPCASHVEDTTEEVKVENVEKSPDARKKTGPPPTPPNKPSSSDSLSNLAEASQSRPNSHPPTPPSKEKKPSNPAVESDQEAPSTADENMGKEEGGKEEAAETTEETDEVDQSISKEAPPSVGEESPDAEGQVSEGESEETMGSDESKACDNEPQIPTETLGSSPSPLLLHKKKPEKPAKPDTQDTGDNATIMQIYEGQDPTALLPTGLDTSASSPRAEEALAKSEVRSVLVYLNDPVSDSLSLSPLLCHLPGEKKKKTEEKSVDSGQHSDVDSEGSGNEDTLAVSTAALRGSHPGLDVFDTSEGDIQIPVSSRPTKAPPKPQVRPKVFPCRRSGPTPPLKPSTKARSASIGDLLSDSSVCVEAGQHTSAVAGGDVVMKLETEVALEMEKTRELLSKVSQAQGEGDREGKTEDLLAKAMEKLKKADYVLKEVKKLKIANNLSNRKSW